MKLVFICGSLEPGKDGVGDYIRMLSAELRLQGHLVLLMAIHDPYVRADDQKAGVESEDNVLRWPDVLQQREELLLCKRALTKFDPDLISLQYVPFSFHPKGLSRQLVSKLSVLGGGRRWHVMIHELWVGMEIQSSFKYKIWGRLQKYLIIGLLKKLQPVITTQTALYQIQLQKMGFAAGVLPLFSNIPIPNAMPIPDAMPIPEVRPIPDAGPIPDAADVEHDEKKDLNFVVFGTIHRDAPIAAFSAEAASYAKERKINMTLTFIGRCGREQESWAAAWSAAGLKYAVLGSQSVQVIAATLRKGSFGLCSTAFVLVEKSGSVAAMRAHGLPVICVAAPWFPMGIKELEAPAGVCAYKTGNFRECIQGKASAVSIFQVRDVARLFLAYIRENENPKPVKMKLSASNLQ